MNISALGKNLIVEMLEKKMESTGGIILTKSDEPTYACVVSVGPEVTEVAENDTLLVNWNKAQKIRDSIYKLSIDDVIGVIEEN